MANLKEIRSRITSIKSTMQITSAMKMVSAAKLKKAQDAITEMRPYADKLTELLQSLSATMDAETGGVFSETREVKNVMLVVVTSNRGLCGGFNSSIIKHTQSLLDGTFAEKNVSLYCIGKKGAEFFNKSGNVFKSNIEIFDDLTYDNVAIIAQELMDAFVEGNYDHIEIVYNSFKNAATQVVMQEQFLPIAQVEQDSNVVLDYIFEPEKAEIIEQLIPKSLKTQVFKSLRDSLAGEHGARMTAMHKATDNASELKDDLTLQYNKARQAAITNEILEIVGGAEALNN